MGWGCVDTRPQMRRRGAHHLGETRVEEAVENSEYDAVIRARCVVGSAGEGGHAPEVDYGRHRNQCEPAAHAQRGGIRRRGDRQHGAHHGAHGRHGHG